MFRIFFLLIGALLLVNIAFAQGNLSGRIYENKTKFPLAGISVQNLKSNIITVSDKNGLFSIKAHVGDLVTFSGFSYQPDTLYVKDLSSVEILLDLKQNMLKGVTVTNSELKLGNLKATPTLSPFGGQNLVYQTDKDGNYNGGLKLNLFDSHSDSKKRRIDEKLEKDEVIKQKIARIFSPENLKDYLPIKGQELTNFIIIYTPSISTYTGDDFNLTLYIDACYKDFIKTPLDRRQSKDFTDLNAKPTE